MAREELTRIVGLCESIEKSGLDPFSVDVKALLRKLRRILETTRELDTVVLDAETIYRISLVIALQQRWLLERAASLFVDAQIVGARVLAADIRTLASCLVRCWRPIVSGEQLTKMMVAAGLEYFLSLPTRSREKPQLPTDLSQLEPDDARALLSGIAGSEVVEEELEKMHEEMLGLRGEDGGLDYWDFIGLRGPGERAERAYLTAFVVSEGLAEIRQNPISGITRIYPREGKIQRENVVSLPLTIRGTEVRDVRG